MDYKALNRYRKRRNLTWAEFAEVVGINAMTLRLIGIGHIKKPQPANAEIIKTFMKENIKES